MLKGYGKEVIPHTAEVSKREIRDTFEYFLEAVYNSIADSGILPKAHEHVTVSQTDYINMALKLTEIHVNNQTSVAIERGDVLSHGLVLGLTDVVSSLNNIAESLNKVGE